MCGGELSKVGNYTNMILSGVKDPKVFDESYGMKCAKHSSELTDLIMSEGKINEAEFEEAFKQAEKLAYKDMV